MALKTFRPTSPGLRQLVLVDRSHLWKGDPVKVLVEGKTKTGGRNHHGRITSRHIGGGHKQAYRMVDFRRRKFDVPATVERLEYDPNRTAFIALIKYEDGQLAYILAPQRLAVGDTVVSGDEGRREAGQRDAAGVDADRLDRAQRRAEAGPRRPDRPLGRILRAARRPRRRLGHSEAVLRRDAPRPPGVHGDGRRRVEPGSRQHVDRQGRPHALDGQAPDGSLDRHEPGRPSERRSYQGRQALGDALGQADQGLQDAQEQDDGQVHRPLARKRSRSDGKEND